MSCLEGLSVIHAGKYMKEAPGFLEMLVQLMCTRLCRITSQKTTASKVN